jgi:hypothetical protein
MQGYSATKNCLVVTVLDTVKTRLEFFHYDAAAACWSSCPGYAGSGAAEIETKYIDAFDSDVNDDLWLTTSGFVQPSTLNIVCAAAAAGAPSSLEPQPLKALPAFYNTDGVVVAQHMATSADGTQIPYFEVSPPRSPEAAQEGPRPTLLYGYGGFEISMLPSYSAAIGSGWLENGGVYILANIRGGGEFGPRWHQAALLEKRHRAYVSAAFLQCLFSSRGLFSSRATFHRRCSSLRTRCSMLLLRCAALLIVVVAHFGVVLFDWLLPVALWSSLLHWVVCGTVVVGTSLWHCTGRLHPVLTVHSLRHVLILRVPCCSARWRSNVSPVQPTVYPLSNPVLAI